MLRAGGTVLFIFVGSHVGLILVINLFIATVTAFFAPAELTAMPRIVDRRHLMAANSVFVLTVNATFAIGFGFFGPLLLTTAGANAVFVVVAVMFGLAAAGHHPAARPSARARGGARRGDGGPCPARGDRPGAGGHPVRARAIGGSPGRLATWASRPA